MASQSDHNDPLPDGYWAELERDWPSYSAMSRDDIEEMLSIIARFDGRKITPTAVDAWGMQSAVGNWDRDGAIAAVQAFYEWSAEEPAMWPNVPGEPRPILPVDVTTFVQMRRLMDEANGGGEY